MDAKHHHSSTKSRSAHAKVIPPGISWQKVKEDADDHDGPVFKQRKAVSRNTNIRSSKHRDGIEKDADMAKATSSRRPNTTLGFEDYFDATESSKKLRALNAKASLQELKRSTLLHPNMPPRNCMSSLAEKFDTDRRQRHGAFSARQSSEDEKSDDLDFTEKIKAFRALIDPKHRISRHDISNEQLRRARSLSEGVEEVGNHVKFSAESSDYSEIRSTTPARLLNEFQLTYEQDKKRSRNNGRLDTNQKHYHDQDDGATEIAPETLNSLPGHPSLRREVVRNRPHLHERQLNEFQLTYEQDRERNRHTSRHEFGSPRHPFDSATTEIPLSAEVANGYSRAHNESQTLARRGFDEVDPQHLSFRKDVKRIIKRPAGSPTRRLAESARGEFAQSGVPMEYSLHEAPSSDDKEIMKYTEPSGANRSHNTYFENRSEDSPYLRERYSSSSRTEGYSVHSILKDGRMASHRRAYSATPEHTRIGEKTLTSESSMTRPNSATIITDHAHQENKYYPFERSQSATPTTGRIRSNLGPSSLASGSASDLSMLEPGASLKAHLNVLGASLSSLSSKLNSGSESDIRSLTADSERSAISSSVALSSVRSGRTDDLMMYGERKTRQHGQAPFDVAGVRVKVRDRHHLQTWSSTSDIRGDHAHNDGHNVHRSSVSGSVTVGSERSSILGSCDSTKQTNVKEYDTDGDQSLLSESQNSTLRSERRKSPFRAESPRQTNGLSDHESSCLISDAKVRRREELQKMVKYISKHRDTQRHFRAKENATGSPHGAKDRARKRSSPQGFDNSDEESDGASGSGSDTLDVVDDDGDIHAEGDDGADNFKHRNGRGLGGSKDENSSSSSPVRVISRKIPLKAVHAFSSDHVKTGKCSSRASKNDRSTDLAESGERLKRRGNDLEKASQDQKEKSPAKSDEKKKRILVKRPQGNSSAKSAGAENEGSGSLSQKFEQKEIHSRRSRSALGVLTADTDFKISHLPSKHELQQFKTKQRPHSSIDTRSPSPKQKIVSRHSGKDQVSKENKGALLMKKVQKLHEEVDQRLSSKKNAAHNTRSYEHTLRKSSGLVDKDSSDELSDASTIVNDESDDDQVVRSKQQGQGQVMKKKASSFVTSTPLKQMDKGKKANSVDGEVINAAMQKDLINGKEDGDQDSSDISDEGEVKVKMSRRGQSSQSPLAKNLKKIIAARNRMTPDFTIKRSTRDEEADEDADRDDLEPAPRHRSGSFGSRQRSDINKKDILSRILNKMSAPSANGSSSSSNSSLSFHHLNGHSVGSTKWMMQPNGVTIHGRASPAESLLNHLENPNMVRLLQRLYKADPDTRQIIMIKVQFFKAWQQYAVSSREHRIRKQTWTQQADMFCVHRLLFYHFVTWERRATHSRNMRRASALFRRHMLTKGFKALRWSISQSRHQSQKLQAKVHGIMLKVSFQKWRTRAEKQRKERIENAWKRWRQYVTETQKIRHMQEVMDANFMMDVLRRWKKCYHRRQKMNMAFSFFRRTLLKQTIKSWCGFVAQCKEKKEKYTTAVSHRQNNLLKSTFFTMVINFKKSRKARTHFRCHRLSEVFWAWKQASQVCRAERQADMAASRQHWEQQKIKLCFTHWQERLKICRAAKKANFNICRRSFLVWRQAWQTNIAHREAIESTVMRNKLHRALLTWRQNVVQLQRRQRMAVALIENCHMKQTFRAWRLYTAARGILKKKALLHHIAYQRKTLVACFSLWQEAYKHRKEEEHAKLLWSQACARKIASEWRLICHKRSLTRLYEATQPERELRLMKAMFTHWFNSLDRRNREKEEADDMKKILERRQLWHKFRFWQAETRRALLIKPLVLRREKQNISECFEAWQSFVKQKSTCKHRKAAFQLEMLRKSFLSWRRQYQACQIEKQIKTQISHGLLLCFWEEWRFLILRKKRGQEFRNRQLVQRMFCYWRDKASIQFTYRARREAEEEHNMELKRQYFSLWWTNVQAQASSTDQCISDFTHRQNERKLIQAFVTWRRHMHSTLIARAYQKTQSQRLLLTLFLAWHEATNSSVSDAVHKFSERIGLVSEMARISGQSSGIGDSEDYDNYFEENESNKSLMSSFNSSFSVGSAARRLFGERDQSLDTDADRMILLSGGLQASADDHQAKCQRLKETVTAAINRLQHWPICVAFEQWRDFTAIQQQLKAASDQLRALHATTEMTVAFREWRNNYISAKKAREHWNAHLLSSSFESLRIYKDHRKFVKHLSQLAHQHRMLVVFRKYFPPWLQKAQEQRQEKHILHLWTSRTAREMELLPLETQLTQKLGRRSLLLCFSLWLVKHRAVAKIRKAYQGSLLTWVFTAWREWASERHSLVSRSMQMLHQRQTRLAFCKWCERLRQSKETERRYHQAWQNYLLLILQEWRIWAKSNRKLHQCQRLFEIQQSRRNLATCLSRWRNLAAKVKEIRSNQTQKLLYSVFVGWRHSVRQIKNEQRKILQFQVHSYTLLVKRLFHQWHSSYTDRQILQQQRKQYAENCALSMATIWRRKAQKTRGERLQVILERRQLASYFQHWKQSLSSVQLLYDKLEVWTQQRNVCMLRQYLRTWRIQLIGDHARKVYTSRVLFTVMAEWRLFAKVNKERRIRGLALKRALQERSLHVYFQYWVAVTRVKQSVQQNVETRLQIRILRSWRYYTRNMRYLKELQAHFTQRVNTRILHSAFMNLRWRGEYCAGLQEMADKVVRDRERATMRAVMVMWKDRLDKILAARCYGHILAVRVARKWQRYVHKKKMERQKDLDNWEAAVRFHQHSLRKKVLAAFKLEVTVSHLAQNRRQRLCNKYAKLWKWRVDMAVTAVTVNREFSQRRAWKKWRVEYTKTRSVKRVSELHERQSLLQVFNAWRRLCPKSSARSTPVSYLPDYRRPSSSASNSSSSSVSMLPVPISQNRSSSASSLSAADMSFGFKGGRRH